MNISRRVLLSCTAALSLPRSLVTEALAQSAVLRTRENITAFAKDPKKVAALRAAVGRMKTLSKANADDPLGWSYWAAVHGTTVAPPANLEDIYSQCDHSDPPAYIAQHFLSWHRAFLYFFEVTLKAAANSAGVSTAFELPYWNWYESGTVPAIFTDGDETTNPLWHPRARTSFNAASLSRTPFKNTDMLPAQPSKWRKSFSVPLEDDPHGSVHGLIGGDMGSVPTSARDPIFWLHHANIDRLWSGWLAMGGGRTTPPSGSAWAKAQWKFDEAGHQTMVADSVTDTQTHLGYKYDDTTPFPALLVANAAAPFALVKGQAPKGASSSMAAVASTDDTAAKKVVSTTSALSLGDKPVAVELALAPASQKSLHALSMGQPQAGGVTSAWLVIEGLKLGEDGRNGGFNFAVKAKVPDGVREVTLINLNTFSLSVLTHHMSHTHTGQPGGPLAPTTLEIPLQDVLQDLGLTKASDLAHGLRVEFQPGHLPNEAKPNEKFLDIGKVSIKTSTLPVE